MLRANRGKGPARLVLVPGAERFDYAVRGYEVHISHRGRPATTLRGMPAARFLQDVHSQDPQELMARLTGNYRRGNERHARTNPRNQNP